MSFIKFLISIIIFASSFAQAANEIEISRTLSIKVPFLISTKVEMPSLHSKFFEISSSQSKRGEILVVQNKPPTYANRFSVERYWKKTRKQTGAIYKNEKNYGCVRASARSFQCSRDAGKDGKFISETIFWNAKNDLVLIRVSSAHSFSESRRFLKQIKITANSRVPAGSSK